MKVRRIVVGNLKENCYLLEKEGKVLIIDPGDDFFKIRGQVKNLDVLKVLITHNHFDHIGALSQILEQYEVGVISYDNLSQKEYQIGPFHFQVLPTSGHTDDSISFYFPEDAIMFVGDFVFEGSIGRCDLPTGDYKMMKESIQRLSLYPKNTKLFPGHGNSTTIELEEKNNPYFT